MQLNFNQRDRKLAGICQFARRELFLKSAPTIYLLTCSLAFLPFRLLNKDKRAGSCDKAKEQSKCRDRLFSSYFSNFTSQL